MNIQKFLIGTLVGGICFFLLGYLFYGALLADFFSKHSVAGSMKSMNEIVWWALIAGNLASGALLTYVFLKLGNVLSFSSGARMGLAIGFFIALAQDLVSWATANSMDGTGAAADIVVGTVMAAISGGIIGAVLGMTGKKKA